MFTKRKESDSILRVLPYTIPESNNLTILSKLKGLGGSESKDTIRQNTVATIPVPKEIDVAELIRQNTQKLLVAKASVYQKSTQGLVGDSEVDDQDVIIDDSDEPRLFVSIEKLYPKNLKDQLSILIIQNFPNVKKLAIEKILKKLTSSKFVWSLFDYEYIENQSIYVKFTSILDARAFIRRYNGKLGGILGNDNIELIADESISEYYKDEENEGEDNDDTEKEGRDNNNGSPVSESTGSAIKQILNTKQHVSKTDDSQEVSQYYGNYKVDNAELVDVPNNMKEAIVKDIIKFRSSVLIIEKQNRMKDLEKERQNTKLRLQKFTQDIKEANDEMVDDSNQQASTIEIDQFDDLNDEEYQKYLLDKSQEEMDSKYQQKLLEIKKLELQEKHSLTKKLATLQDYETNLLDNKIKYIDDLRDVDNYDKNSSLPSIIQLYLKNHSQYMKLRSQKRSLEEIQDAKDAKDELEENKRKQPESIKTNVKLAAKPKPKVSQIDVNLFLVDQVKNLYKKVEELVEEYLGIKDEYLVDTINQNLKVNDLSSKDTLVAELTEVLDEDAVNLVDDLYNYIHAI